MSESVFGQTFGALDEAKVSTRKDPIFGDVTVFHDVVIVRENVQPYPIDGEIKQGYKSADMLEQYWPYVDGRWAIAGRHPTTPVIVSPNDIMGRTVNPRFVKNLVDHGKTERPNIRGILADLEVFNDRVAPAMLEGMLDGSIPAVSIGFLFGKDFTPGTWNGRPYDFVQTNMFHDHLAFGIIKGRCDYPACGIGADELLAPKCLNSGCSNREVSIMEPGKTPEETDTLISIPNPGVDGCEESEYFALTSTGDIGCHACGDDHQIHTFIFTKADDWDMEKAAAWVEENREGAADLLVARLEVIAAEDAVKTRAMEHYELTGESWDSISDAARTTLTEALPEVEPAVDADMSEDDIKAKIESLEKEIGDIYDEIEKADTPDYARIAPLRAEVRAYEDALAVKIEARVLLEVTSDEGSGEVERAKRLLNEHRQRTPN